MKYFSSLLLIIAIAVSGAFAQTTPKVPKFKKGEHYSGVRKKLKQHGWQAYTAPDADTCSEGDKRCQGRPEMQSCAGTGMANCRFLWKKAGKTLVIFTIGELAVYDDHAFEEIAEN